MGSESLLWVCCISIIVLSGESAISDVPTGFTRFEGHCYKAVYFDNATTEFDMCLRQCKLQTVKCMSFAYRFEKKRCLLMWQRCTQSDTRMDPREPDWLTYVKVDNSPLASYNQLQGRCSRQYVEGTVTAGVGVYFSQTNIKLRDCATLCNSHGLQLCKSFNYNYMESKCELVFYWCNGRDVDKAKNGWVTYVQKSGTHPKAPGYSKIEAKCERQTYMECHNCNFTKCQERCNTDPDCRSFSYRFGNYSRCRMNRDTCFEVDTTIDAWAPYSWASYNKEGLANDPMIRDRNHPTPQGFQKIRGVCMTNGIGSCPGGPKGMLAQPKCSFKECCKACANDKECKLFWFNFEKRTCWRYSQPCKVAEFRTNPTGSAQSSSYNKVPPADPSFKYNGDIICPEIGSPQL